MVLLFTGIPVSLVRREDDDSEDLSFVDEDLGRRAYDSRSTASSTARTLQGEEFRRPPFNSRSTASSTARTLQSNENLRMASPSSMMTHKNSRSTTESLPVPNIRAQNTSEIDFLASTDIPTPQESELDRVSLS